MAEKKKRKKWWLFLLIPIGVIGFYFLSIFGEIWVAELMHGEGSPFDKGKGTIDSPYIIKTTEQLIEFRKKVNEGFDYEGKYIRLDSDIQLNDEVFSFNEETKMLKVTDGTNVGYIKIIAEAEEGSTLDWSKSDLGDWYADETGTTRGEYLGELTEWDSVGYSFNCAFKGTFDGNGHKISGIFSYCHGVFGWTNNATIKNLDVDNSYICRHDDAGGIVGNATTSKIENCSFSGYISGYSSIGGIVGFSRGSKIINCENKGIISSYTVVGGIVGFSRNSEAAIELCCNYGMVQGVIATGGIVGSLMAGDVTNCLNAGDVLGNDSTGGITGGVLLSSGEGIITNCINTGIVKQALEVMENENYIGVICGYNVENISNCYVKVNGLGTLIGGVTDPIDESKIKVLSIEELKNKDSYKDLDFDNIWIIEDGYPKLR